MTVICPLFIAGKSVMAENQRTFERHNPVNDAVASRAAAASVNDAVRAADAAAKAFLTWRDTTPALRRSLLLNAADELEKRSEQFVTVMAAETGATPHWAGFNVHLGAEVLREAATLIDGDTREMRLWRRRILWAGESYYSRQWRRGIVGYRQ